MAALTATTADGGQYGELSRHQRWGRRQMGSRCPRSRRWQTAATDCDSQITCRHGLRCTDHPQTETEMHIEFSLCLRYTRYTRRQSVVVVSTASVDARTCTDPHTQKTQMHTQTQTHTHRWRETLREWICQHGRRRQSVVVVVGTVSSADTSGRGGGSGGDGCGGGCAVVRRRRRWRRQMCSHRHCCRRHCHCHHHRRPGKAAATAAANAATS